MQVTQVIQVIKVTQEIQVMQAIQVMQVKQVTFIHIIHIFTYYLSYVRLGHLWSDLWSDWVIFGVLYLNYFCLIVFQAGQLIPIWPICAPLICREEFCSFPMDRFLLAEISLPAIVLSRKSNFWVRIFLFSFLAYICFTLSSWPNRFKILNIKIKSSTES